MTAMYLDTTKVPARRGRLLSQCPLAQAVERRAMQVGGLLLQRRKIAMAYRRTQSEDQRLALTRIDHELAAFNIDIPGVWRGVGEPNAGS